MYWTVVGIYCMLSYQSQKPYKDVKQKVLTFMTEILFKRKCY